MPALETLLVTVLAPVVTKALVGAWTGDADLVSDAKASVIDWAFGRLGDRAAAQRAARPLERIGEEVVRDIQPLFERAVTLTSPSSTGSACWERGRASRPTPRTAATNYC